MKSLFAATTLVIGTMVGSLSGCAADKENDPSDGVLPARGAAREDSPPGSRELSLLVGAEIVVNEVESSGGSPGDWVELLNVGTSTINVGGWLFRDNDNSHTYTIASGTAIPVGGYLVLNEAQFGFGLGASDSARLFNASGTLIDTYSWTTAASTTYGRCPNGTGALTTTLASTKGAANQCGLTMEAWPGNATVATSDASNAFGSNLSGLTYESSLGVLWAVQNNPSKIFRLVRSGSIWTHSTSNGWSAGKTMVYPNGSGVPDSEGVTRGDLSAQSVYVATERNNSASGTSRNSVLRFDISGTGTTLLAAQEWNLTTNLPAVDANTGLEAVTFVPDAALVAKGFIDESTGLAYSPSGYASHGGGVFFVGLEANGMIYGYVLNHTNSTFTRVATFSSGQKAVMGLEYDADFGYLLAHCDDTCGNVMSLLAVDTVVGSLSYGKYVARIGFNRPSGMGNLNNEGIALAPESECSAGTKRFIWSDDGASNGHSLRDGALFCGPLY